MSDLYEQTQILDEYLLFHYGKEEEILNPEVKWPDGMRQALDFAKRTPSHFLTKSVGRGLDLGCAVGRSTFEMSKCCHEVIGLDYSHRFINAANAVKNHGSLDYSRLDEAGLKTPLSAKIPVDLEPEKVSFIQGDAMRLPGGLGQFDRVHAANLICRLSQPSLLLDRLPDLVVPGGELVLATPCTWLETFTPKEYWPNPDTLGWLKARLGAAFLLHTVSDEPFLIRETARKFQWTRSLVTVWSRL
jgi:putative 4-mercaptohistidine N1-methyltranferase